MWIRDYILRKASLLTIRRRPDVIIGGIDDPYMLRWYIIPKNRLVNIYVHLFLRSDDDRALHTHPWVNASLLLRGSYIEHTKSGTINREAGSFVFRHSGKIAHRIELVSEDCLTLFVTGPKYQEWGFLCPRGFVHWKDFGQLDEEGVERGCS